MDSVFDMLMSFDLTNGDLQSTVEVLEEALEVRADVTLKFVSQFGGEKEFKHERFEALGTLFHSYSQMMKKDKNELVFYHRGTKLVPSHTPADLRMKTKDIINVYEVERLFKETSKNETMTFHFTIALYEEIKPLKKSYDRRLENQPVTQGGCVVESNGLAKEETVQF